MKRRDRHLPSPALLIACAALFVAFGGTVWAAAKIDGKTIRVKSLPGNRLKPGSVPGNRLVPGSVKGEQVDTATLAQVPDASHADSAGSARHAATAIAAVQAADADKVNGRSVGCPSTAREFAGACWDLQPSPSALTAPEAAAACAAVGGELPSALALLAFVQQPGVRSELHGEWMSDIRVDSGGIYNVPVLEDGATMALKAPTEPHRFRCVTPLLH